MLLELSIRNFAIISSLNVSFHKGLNVLTGETGAGKSIVIDAISLLIGGRASADYVRHGENKAEIEGLFDMSSHASLQALCAQWDIESEDGTLILRRDIHRQGKNVCRVNGKLVPLSILRQIGQSLVDIHGQHEHHSLLRQEQYIPLLDAYGKKDIEPDRSKYEQLFNEFTRLTQEIKRLSDSEQQIAQRIDLLRFQMNEIAAAELKAGEDQQLEQEKKKRLHAQKLYEGMETAYQALHGEGRALESLSVVLDQLEELTAVDTSLQPFLDKVRDMYFELEDMSRTFGEYKEHIEFDPQHINHIENRLVQIDQLKRKYGASVEDILAYADKIKGELDDLVHKDERVDALREQQKALLADLIRQAARLTEQRRKVARHLVKHIHKELKDLYMDQTVVNIAVEPLANGQEIEHEGRKRFINKQGWDEVKILISANPGEPLKPLSKTASGGELSRFMLSLKTVFSRVEPVATMIFDEVDTGVSGRVAGAMAEKLLAISRDQQVLCITHQPQVAALSDHHYRIVKEVDGGSTMTNIIPLNDEEKQLELARMMGGDEVTSASANHAHELFESARNLKQKWQELSK